MDRYEDRAMSDLVRGLQAGDASAFERFVKEHGDRLYRFVRRMVGDRWTEDALQETLLRLHRSMGKYKPTGSFQAWVYTVASRVCLDFLRRSPGRSAPLSDEHPILLGGPEAELYASEMRDAIRRAVERLPEEQRQVFLLREEAGVSFAEIARIMNCPLNTALGRMYYALQNLKKRLAAFRD